MWGFLKGAAKSLLPIAGDLLGISMAGKGQRDANQRNIELAREQMAFQERMAHSAQAFSERMSSTAVRRSMEDYKAAGLNPALAYENTASSPTGVTAGGSLPTVQNVAASAYAIRTIQQQMDIARRDFDLRQKATDAAVKKTDAETKAIEQAADFQRIEQPYKLRSLSAQALLQELGLTAAENEAELEKWIKEQSAGKSGGSKTLMKLLQLIASTRN